LCGLYVVGFAKRYDGYASGAMDKSYTKYRYQAIKQKKQSKLNIQKTRLSHKIRRHNDRTT